MVEIVLATCILVEFIYPIYINSSGVSDIFSKFFQYLLSNTFYLGISTDELRRCVESKYFNKFCFNLSFHCYIKLPDLQISRIYSLVIYCRPIPVQSSIPKVHISSDDNDESTPSHREKDSWEPWDLQQMTREYIGWKFSWILTHHNCLGGFSMLCDLMVFPRIHLSWGGEDSSISSLLMCTLGVKDWPGIVNDGRDVVNRADSLVVSLLPCCSLRRASSSWSCWLSNSRLAIRDCCP